MSETGIRKRLAEVDPRVPFRAVEGLVFKPLPNGKGKPREYVVRARGGRPCSLAEEEYCIVTMLDGSPSFGDIEHEFSTRFGSALSRPHFQEFMEELLTAGIVERVAANISVTTQGRPARETGTGPTRASADEQQDDTPAAGVASDSGGGISLLPMYMLLAQLGSPLRFFIWLLIPASVFAAVLVLGHEPQMLADLTASNWTAPGRIPDILVGALTVVLVPVLVRGGVAAFHGAPRQAFRLRISGRFLRAGLIDRDCIDLLPRKGRSWSYAAPLLARLGLFVGAGLLWVSRGAGEDEFAFVCWLISQAALWLFLLTSIPVLRSGGSRWMSAYFSTPVIDRDLLNSQNDYDDDAANIDSHAIHRSKTPAFRISGVVIALVAIAGMLLPWCRPVLVTPAITAPVVFITAFVAALIWLRVASAVTGPLRADIGPGRDIFGRSLPGQPVSWARSTRSRRQIVGDGPVSLDDRLHAWDQSSPTEGGVLRGAILLALLVSIIFLPYPYESGGSFTVLPYTRVYLPARVSGEVMEVLVREGEWVKPGQVVGILSDWSEVHNLSMAEEALEKALANLQNLLITPKPEEVAVARQQYEQAMSRLPFSKEDYERKLALVKTNDISVRQFQLAQSTYEQDLAAVNVTRANYDLVRVGPTQAQIDEARAQVHAETDQVAYWKDQVSRTRIRATEAGQVVTPDPQLMMGTFLQEGTSFIRTEDHRVAHVEVQVPETDIRDIRLGALVRAKAWGYEHTMWHGTVTLIAPDAQPSPPIGGNIVRVVAEIPNPDGLLRPDMTGDAKVATVDMPVWVSYTRALMRFLLIEVWYWIP